MPQLQLLLLLWNRILKFHESIPLQTEKGDEKQRKGGPNYPNTYYRTSTSARESAPACKSTVWCMGLRRNQPRACFTSFDIRSLLSCCSKYTNTLFRWIFSLSLPYHLFLNDWWNREEGWKNEEGVNWDIRKEGGRMYSVCVSVHREERILFLSRQNTEVSLQHKTLHTSIHI